jgi:NitT/TauT family transport system permease protein
MALILFHTEKVKRLLADRKSVGAELFVLAGVAAVIGGLALIGERVAAPMPEKFEISLSLWALPKYTAFTLLRGVVAYLLSLLFTLVYGIVAAHHRRAERVMVPAMDVFQSLPVLTFLPGLVLVFVHLFPTRQVGLELVAIITIFTGQVPNMAFSFFGSVRGVPGPLREVTVIQRLSGWQVFRLLEVPASMIGLVWNSMMSMAGGWFFITTIESFDPYKLPGLGSFMSEAQAAGNVRAQVGAVIAMIAMIVFLDQVVWRPIVAWSERFKLEDTAAADQPKSWVLDMFHRSRLLVLAHRLAAGRGRARGGPGIVAKRPPDPRRERAVAVVFQTCQWAVLIGLAAVVAWGTWALIRLLGRVPLVSASHADWRFVVLALLASFGRVAAAVVLGGLWTLPAGILIGLSPRWSQRLQPIVQVVASFPAPMLFPWVVAGVAFFHVPFTFGCIALLLLGTQWYVLFNVIAGAMAIPSELREAARVYRLSRWTVWRELYIPGVFPYLVTGLVTAAGGAWNATIVAEYFQMGGYDVRAFGLGATISDASNAAHPNAPLLAASAVTMAVFVVGVNRVLWKRLYRLAASRYSLAS